MREDGDGFFYNVQFLREPFVGRAQGPHFGGFRGVGRQGRLGRFLSGIEPLGIDI